MAVWKFAIILWGSDDLPVEEENFMGSSYRNLLLQIAENVTPKILEDLKFLCLDDIEEGELEQISSPLKLFKALERRELLGINDL